MKSQTRTPWPSGGFKQEEGYRSFILTENDIPRAQVLMEESLDFFLLFSGQPAVENEGENLFSELPKGRQLTDKTIFGLFHQEKLVGVIDSVVGYPDEFCWFIGLFLIHPDWRGGGLGSNWLEAYLAHAKANGARTVRLGVVEQNIAGRRFWERNGFSLEARRLPMRFGVKDCVVLLMCKEL